MKIVISRSDQLMALLLCLRSLWPLIFSAVVILGAFYAGGIGRSIAVFSGFATYAIAFHSLVFQQEKAGEGDNAGVWPVNAFALGVMFLVGIMSI